MLNLYNEITNFNNSKLALIENNRGFSYKQLHSRINYYFNILSTNPFKKIVGIDCISNFNYVAATYACFKCKRIAVPLMDKNKRNAIKKLLKIEAVIGDEKIKVFNINKEKVGKIFNTNISTIIFTSGTTTRYLKGVKLSHRSISHVSNYMNKRMEINKNIIENIYAPLDHAFAFGRLHSILSIGGTVIVPNNFIILTNLIKDIINFKCNAFSTMPVILGNIFKFDKYKIEVIKQNIKWIQIGTMRLESADRDKVINLFSESRIFYHYGMTEAMRTTFLELNKEKDKIYTEGRPIDGVKVCILDSSNKKIAIKKLGKIAIKGKNLFNGYIDNYKKTNLQKGWFITSDQGYLDDKGYLIYKGRKGDLINIKGQLLNIIEMEERVKSLFPKLTIVIVALQKKVSSLLLAIEGSECLKTKKYIKKKLFAENIFISRIIFLNKFPRSSTMKVIKNKILEFVNESN